MSEKFNSREFFEAVLRQTSDAILITDAPLDGTVPRIVFANDAFYRLTGYGRNETVGRAPVFLYGERTDQAELERVLLALKDARPVQSTMLIYTKSGTECWIDLRITPVLNKQGLLTGFVSIQRDITREKLLEDALRAERDRLKLVSRLAGDFIWDWDVVAHEVTLFMPPGGALGYRMRELVCASGWWLERVHDDDARNALDAMDRAMAAGLDRVDRKYRLRCADGNFAAVCDSARILYKDDKAVRLVGAVRIQSECTTTALPVESAGLATTAAAGGVSPDASGSAQSEERDNLAISEEAVPERIATAEEGPDDFRESSTTTLPHTHPETVPVTPQTAHSAPTSILIVDDDLMVREFAARILTSAGYLVSVASGVADAARVVASLHAAPSLVISDVVLPDGAGLELAQTLVKTHPQIPVLFISGYSAEAVTERGMLSHHAQFLAKPFTSVELLGAVESMLRGIAPARNPTVLIADDDAGVRQFLRELLAVEEYDIHEAADGRELLRLLKAEPADLVLTDMAMPGLNGFELVRHVRVRYPQVAILAFSGSFIGEPQLPEALEAGADIVLAKPIDPVKLLRFVREFVASKRAQRST